MKRLIAFVCAAALMAGCSDAIADSSATSSPADYDWLMEYVGDTDYATFADACPLRTMPGAKDAFVDGFLTEPDTTLADAEGMWLAFLRWCRGEGL